MKFFARVPNIDFMAQRRTGLVVSTVLSIAAIVLLATRGLNFGIDFTGGVLVEVAYPQSVELGEVRGHLTQAGYHNAVAQYFGGTQNVLIRLPPAENSSSAEVSTKVLETLGSGVELRRIEFVGPQVGEELSEQGSLALLIAFIGIFIYIWFRFVWKFSVGAIAALIHDALMALGFLSALWIEFDVTTLAAILALIGYSNNETVVIFDRVRENMIGLRRADVLEVVNLSVNQTLLRSIITHVTTLLVCTALFVLGGATVHSFSVTLIVGVIVATYSSIYISTNLAVAIGLKREDLLPPKLDEQADKMP
ncbi:MAG: protein translocase subunit SecF [Nevskiaceae bacterium]